MAKVLGTNPFYDGTNEISIFHTTTDGRKFIVRYGELDPPSIKVKIGDEVKQGQHIGNTGKLINPKTNRPRLKLGNVIVYMLHLELYTSKVSCSINPPLTDKTKPPFLRRSDLVDPIEILSEGYANTFNNSTSKEERLDTTTLHTSENGKIFIKGWESLRLNAYNDSHGHCTIGYGHLIDSKDVRIFHCQLSIKAESLKVKQMKYLILIWLDLKMVSKEILMLIYINVSLTHLLVCYLTVGNFSFHLTGLRIY